MSHQSRIALGLAALALAPLASGLIACGTDGGTRHLAVTPYDATGQLSFTPASDDGAADPDQPLAVTVSGEDSRITDVSAADAAGRPLAGELTADGHGWRSTAPLAARTRYTVRVSTENGEGAPGRLVHAFRTGTSDDDGKRFTVTLGPGSGTYGVGQPVTAELSHAVEKPGERALVESSLRVRSRPAVTGSWHWVDDRTLHYRPQNYWPADATVTVSSALAGAHLRDGLRGGTAEPVTFRTGDRVEAVADISTLQMTVLRNGEELRTMPMTTGKEGFRTRNGKKVILGRESYVRMTGTSIGIPAGSAESYDLSVYWAARLTWSGEYVHGAPWSVGSQGSENVSHGCTGLSTENARWFYDLVKPGDVVEHVNGYGEEMAPFGNGFGDWNLSWEEWQAGSALRGADDAAANATPADDAATTGRLRPGI